MKKNELLEGEGRTILLHCCCGPCATSSIETLQNLGWKVVLYYQNDNIFPESEWEKRYVELEKVANYYSVELIGKENYNHEAWREKIKGLETCLEHGKRCLVCFDYNLALTYQMAKKLKIEHFCTTLTVSRFKDSQQIFEVGKKYPIFEAINLKKKDGFARSVKLSKELKLYRQQYCGCEFSMPKEEKHEPNL